MPFNTQAEWRGLFESTKGHMVQVKKRLDVLDTSRFVGAPLGLDDPDPEATSRPLTQQEINQIKTQIRNHALAVIADWQAALA